MPPPVDVKPVITKPPPAQSNAQVWGAHSEDWETDSKGYEAAYNPEDKLKSGNFLYQPRGLQPAERRQYRLEQRIKASSMHNQSNEMDEDDEDDGEIGGWDEGMEIEPSKPPNKFEEAKPESFSADVKPNINIKRESSTTIERSPPPQHRQQGRQASSSSSQSKYASASSKSKSSSYSSARRGGRNNSSKEDGEVSEEEDFELFYGDDPFS